MSNPTPLRRNGDQNKLQPEDRPVHSWYRFVLSFPPHLVRDYLERFAIRPGQTVLDPFCGTGTVLVEALKHGVSSVGLEANPMAHFASATKLNWTPDPSELKRHVTLISDHAKSCLDSQGIQDTNLVPINCEGLLTLPSESAAILLANSISPLPLHKALVLKACIEANYDVRFHDHEMLALATVVVNSASNLHFGPEVGVGPAKPDAPVLDPWIGTMSSMISDLEAMPDQAPARGVAYREDSRNIGSILEPQSIDAVITSPPYPNEKDYTRTTRLESVLLGFFADKYDLQTLKKQLVRSNTRSVYKADDDHLWVKDFPEIDEIALAIERRRIELGKTSGFERMYPRVTKLYFGGMARHLADLRQILKPGAHLAYVVGDQASYLQVMIETGRLLAEIGLSLGYELVGIDLFRTRLATATRQQLREEVVILRWPG